jgi:hypothetical protein
MNKTLLLGLLAIASAVVLQPPQVADAATASDPKIKCMQSELGMGVPALAEQGSSTLAYWNFSVYHNEALNAAAKCGVQILSVGNFDQHILTRLVQNVVNGVSRPVLLQENCGYNDVHSYRNAGYVITNDVHEVMNGGTCTQPYLRWKVNMNGIDSPARNISPANGLGDGGSAATIAIVFTATPAATPTPTPTPTLPQCSDGIDNDGDGKIDLADPGCENANDDDERDGATPSPTPVVQVVKNKGDDNQIVNNNGDGNIINSFNNNKIVKAVATKKPTPVAIKTSAKDVPVTAKTGMGLGALSLLSLLGGAIGFKRFAL